MKYSQSCFHEKHSKTTISKTKEIVKSKFSSNLEHSCRLAYFVLYNFMVFLSSRNHFFVKTKKLWPTQSLV